MKERWIKRKYDKNKRKMGTRNINSRKIKEHTNKTLSTGKYKEKKYSEKNRTGHEAHTMPDWRWSETCRLHGRCWMSRVETPEQKLTNDRAGFLFQVWPLGDKRRKLRWFLNQRTHLLHHLLYNHKSLNHIQWLTNQMGWANQNPGVALAPRPPPCLRLWNKQEVVAERLRGNMEKTET